MSKMHGVLVMAMFAFALTFSQDSFSAPAVEALRCENLVNPLGIGTTQPRFSWRLSSGDRGLSQSAYQIVVMAEDTGAEKVLWDSGKVESSQSSFVAYDGESLSVNMRCRWKVRVWDQNDEVSDWSDHNAGSFFTVGPMTAKDWHGEWIGVDWMANNEGALPLLRKKITLTQLPVYATAHVCALGYYELYVNGEKVGEEVLSPAVSDYSKRGLYITHDLTPFLKEGDNCVGLWLGRGWSMGIIEKATTEGPLVKTEMAITYADGTAVTQVTDDSWKMHPSHITPLGRCTSGDYGGELVDSSKEIADWSKPEYDDSQWKNAVIHHPPTSIIAAQMMETNRLLDVIEPVSVVPLDDGYLVDMGRNYTGWFEIQFPDDMKAGVKVDFEYGDKRFPDGTFQTYRQRDTYIAKGGGKEQFRNRFNYHAFRWAIIKGLPRSPRLDEIQGHLISTNYDTAASFTCDHALLNDIYKTAVWTHRCLSLGGYTVDCPHRERLGYGGDSGTSMEAAMLNFRSGPFYAKWAADWRDAQAENGDVPYTAPHAQDAGGGPVWSGFCITMPWQTYVSYGDQRVLELGWPVMQKWLSFIDTKMEDGLLMPYVGIGCASSEWSFLGDWVPPGRKQGQDRVDDRSTLFFNNVYLVHCLQLAAKIGTILGHESDAMRYSEQANALGKLLHQRFLNEDGATYANGEQTYLAMPLLFNITPDTHRTQVMTALEKDIVETRHGHLNTGMHGNYYMARYLISQQRNDLMTMMMTKDTYPSYGYMLKNGATTIWEEWDGDNSQIHNTMISIGMWFIRGLGGIQADETYPGFKHFTAAPGVESGLGQVRTTLMSEYGQIISEWKREGNAITYNLTVPPNSTATVVLPAVDMDQALESGQALSNQNGVSDIACNNGCLRCTVVSGTYVFHTKTAE